MDGEAEKLGNFTKRLCRQGKTSRREVAREYSSIVGGSEDEAYLQLGRMGFKAKFFNWEFDLENKP